MIKGCTKKCVIQNTVLKVKVTLDNTRFKKTIKQNYRPVSWRWSKTMFQMDAMATNPRSDAPSMYYTSVLECSTRYVYKQRTCAHLIKTLRKSSKSSI